MSTISCINNRYWCYLAGILGGSFDVMPHGDNICWFRMLPFSQNFELYQVVPASKLGAGTYRVRCKLWNNHNQKGNCRLFANQNVQYFGCKDEYANNQVDGESATYAGYGGTPDGMFLLKDMQVYVTLADGEDLRLGIRSDGRKSNGTRASDGTGWFKVDYFRIHQVDKDNNIINTIHHTKSAVMADTKSYTLGGRCVQRLQKGIYVQKGRKIMK